MKKVILTQRVDVIQAYDEKRDAIDQRWTDFLMSINILPIFISNNLLHVEAILSNEDIDGVILTGGGSLIKYRGNSLERDQVEKYIIDWAIDCNIPVLGVCRGMQFIQDYFGIPLKSVNNHVGVRHKLNVNKGLRLSALIEPFIDVNSFHNLGTSKSNRALLAVANAEDGIVMAVEHSEKNIFGVMWHCEREDPFKIEDKDLVRHLFC